MTEILAKIKAKGNDQFVELTTMNRTIMPQKEVVETFKRAVIRAGKSATIITREDGSVQFTIHCKPVWEK